ncbi:hypothetical protein E3N88_37080 [Mikania micrantha]|uniref:Uncharacterized protein n=1 Tax=Mikania micrantha TaxID=192012 RepID=A0A5N6M5F1_9ASTR|nr:hypothetical protein E3N88_37080 [Mikania micrantha]
MGSSRYAMEGLRILRGTRCLENILDFSGNRRGTRSLLWLPAATQNSTKSPSKLHFQAIRSYRSHQESSIQVLIVVLTADIRQISIKKSSSLELYLVNPCGAEQESLIVLLADNPFAGRIASPLV